MISVVIPVYNEEGNIEELFGRLRTVMEGAGREYEVIIADDGSTDGTGEVLRNLAAVHGNLRVLRFNINYGQTAALSAGFESARGDIIITLDGDLQNNPEDIPALIEKLESEKLDTVCGWRSPRRDSLSRRLVSWAANMIISRICGLKLHDYGCTLKAYRAGNLKDVRLYGEMHRFIPAFIYWGGGRVAEMKVSHSPRTRGRSSYGMNRIFSVILDLITTKFLTTYSTKPIHVFGMLGFISMAAGLLTALYVIVRKYYMGGEWISPLFFIFVFLLGLGLVFILMGILAEISVRIYFAQTRGVPYKVRKID
ncbi:MAG: glycosyltransferase family 2 protein [Elusimicrobia bacterium]|nr:glycosyltransferase family 2 protein [Elusimicrobiota bacterium]